MVSNSTSPPLDVEGAWYHYNFNSGTSEKREKQREEQDEGDTAKLIVSCSVSIMSSSQ